MYLDGVKDCSLLYFDQRLSNRKAIIEWNKELLMLIFDEQGVEQGGIKSGELYKIYNNEQLKVSQASPFGINIGDNKIAAIGQADDVALVSTDNHSLCFLLSLTMSYCAEYFVDLSNEKTQLQVYSSKSSQSDAEYWTKAAPISIHNNFFDFVDTAVHVGILRSFLWSDRVSWWLEAYPALPSSPGEK